MNQQIDPPTTSSIGDLAKALATAQGQFGVAQADAWNPHFKSRYATLAAIMAAVQPALSQAGLAVLQIPAVAGKTVSVETVLIHGSGQRISCLLSADARDTGPQAIGSVISYLRRYGLASLLSVATGEDDDGEGATARPATRPQPTPPIIPITVHSRPQGGQHTSPPMREAPVYEPEPGPEVPPIELSPDAVEIPEPTERERYMKKLHAIGHERGLGHEDLRFLMRLESMKDAPEGLLFAACEMLGAHHPADLARAWGRNKNYQGSLVALKDWCKGELEKAHLQDAGGTP